MFFPSLEDLSVTVLWRDVSSFSFKFFFSALPFSLRIGVRTLGVFTRFLTYVMLGADWGSTEGWSSDRLVLTMSCSLFCLSFSFRRSSLLCSRRESSTLDVMVMLKQQMTCFIIIYNIVCRGGEINCPCCLSRTFVAPDK